MSKTEKPNDLDISNEMEEFIQEQKNKAEYIKGLNDYNKTVKVNESASEEFKNWYYTEEKEDKIGPLTEEEIFNLLKKGIINRDTLVWTKGMEAWLPIKKTQIVMFIEEIPPIPPNHNTNRYLYVLISFPFIASILQIALLITQKIAFYSRPEFQMKPDVVIRAAELGKQLAVSQYWVIAGAILSGILMFKDELKVEGRGINLKHTEGIPFLIIPIFVLLYLVGLQEGKLQISAIISLLFVPIYLLLRGYYVYKAVDNKLGLLIYPPLWIIGCAIYLITVGEIYDNWEQML